MIVKHKIVFQGYWLTSSMAEEPNQSGRFWPKNACPIAERVPETVPGTNCTQTPEMPETLEKSPFDTPEAPAHRS